MSGDRRFLQGLARAFGGAIIFNLPLWMTMEMWWLGFYMDRPKLVLLIVANIPLLVLLSHFSGFEDTETLWEDVVDAFVAFAVGVTASTAVLMLLGIINGSMGRDEVVGKIALQTVPASIGALLAQSQFGEESQSRERRRTTYWGGLFIMGVGALFLSWNVAPTEEVVRIAMTMTPTQGILTVVLSIAIVHAFMFAADFRGEPEIPEGTPGWNLFLRETIVGYAIAFLLSAYVLWSFGRLDGTAFVPSIMMIVVLGLPAALGAAAARLIL
jgi:putative integral membrane protein (TIGR02587 family)